MGRVTPYAPSRAAMPEATVTTASQLLQKSRTIRRTIQRPGGRHGIQ